MCNASWLTKHVYCIARFEYEARASVIPEGEDVDIEFTMEDFERYTTDEFWQHLTPMQTEIMDAYNLNKPERKPNNKRAQQNDIQSQTSDLLKCIQEQVGFVVL